MLSGKAHTEEKTWNVGQVGGQLGNGDALGATARCH